VWIQNWAALMFWWLATGGDRDLVQEVELLVDHGVGGRHEEGHRKIEWLRSEKSGHKYVSSDPTQDPKVWKADWRRAVVRL
jgi:hypothetical protein